MTIQHSFYFDPFYSNRYLDFKVSLINSVAKTVYAIMRRFHIHSLKTGVVSRLNKDLSKIYLMVLGIKSAIADPNFNVDNIEDKYAETEKVIKKFKKIYHVFDKVDFFHSIETKNLCNDILITLYSIEGKLKYLTFKDSNANGVDDDLKNVASIISIKSLQSLHASAI